MSKKENAEGFEKSMEKLRQFADQIQRPDISIEDALKCYEEGMKCYDSCMSILESAKQKIETEEVPKA
ncbi:MAG: exodeoxyribonuclease VII small subunit [Eubacterium sp.]